MTDVFQGPAAGTPEDVLLADPADAGAALVRVASEAMGLTGARATAAGAGAASGRAR